MSASLLALLWSAAQVSAVAPSNDCLFFAPFDATPAGPDAWSTGILDAHNCARRDPTPSPSPALPALTWNASLSATAQGWANQCIFGHNPNRGSNVGENIFAGSNAFPAATVVDYWALEAQDYDYATNTCAAGKVCGHYTQLVWRNTATVGCAQASCPGGLANAPGLTYIVVCDYSPAGNWIGQSPY